MNVNLLQLVGILEAYRGALIVSATMRTQPPLLAKSRATKEPTFDRYPNGVERVAFGRFMLATNYEANVVAQRGREDHVAADQFEAGPLWPIKCPLCNGEGCAVCHDTGKIGMGRHYNRFLVVHVRKSGVFYLRCRPAADDHGRPVKIRDAWAKVHDGSEIEGDELADVKANYLKSKPKPSVKQELAREIPYRPYEVGGVDTLTVGGVVYELDHDGSTPEWYVPGPALPDAVLVPA